jgi:ribose 5-phosphate isomerase
MTKVWQLMLLWGVVIGIGTGMTALVLGATIAARWFAARRGLVVGILTASVATGHWCSCRCWRASPNGWAGGSRWRWSA